MAAPAAAPAPAAEVGPGVMTAIPMATMLGAGEAERKELAPEPELAPELEAGIRAVAARFPAADILEEGVPEGCPPLRGYEPADGKPPFFGKAKCLRGLALHRRASCLGALGGATGVPLLAAAAAWPSWRCSISSSGRRLQERSDAAQGGSIGSTCSEFIASQPKGCTALSEAQWT